VDCAQYNDVMSALPEFVHTAAQVRALDRYAIDELGTAGYELMSRAGAAALACLRRRWPDAKRITVVCGSGNNGGDGYVLARLARQQGLKVTAIALTDPTQLQGDAKLAWQGFSAAGGQAIAWLDASVANADVIVDAIFGTGLSRALDAAVCAHIDAMNAAEAPILALDIPSGLHADTGKVMGAAVQADCTITFVGLKIGLYVGVAQDYVGDLEFDSLDIPPLRASVLAAKIGIAAHRLDIPWLRTVLNRRSRLAHKGSNGHVLIIGGGSGMAGAVRLAGEACLRVGAGLVTIATCAENVAAVVTDRPELIVRAVTTVEQLAPLISKADVVAIGPGLGQSEWARSLLGAVFEMDKPLVVDADGLNLLALRPQKRANWVLTPHPGEAGRLLGCSSADIQSERYLSVTQLAQRYGGVVVLKGAGTLIACAGEIPALCDRGNPGMATPGMGDVLTGVIAGLLGQLDDVWLAAQSGVLVHAMAGDLAVDRLGPNVDRGLIASDLFMQLPVCVSDGSGEC
jgi:NAD(P)H-hydrate epimerase